MRRYKGLSRFIEGLLSDWNGFEAHPRTEALPWYCGKRRRGWRRADPVALWQSPEWIMKKAENAGSPAMRSQ